MGDKEGLKKIEEEGYELDSWPTDSFDGSNTGIETLYYLNGTFWLIDREIEGNKVYFTNVTDRDMINQYNETYIRKNAKRKTVSINTGLSLPSMNPKGWHREPINHALASKGIKVGKNREKR